MRHMPQSIKWFFILTLSSYICSYLFYNVWKTSAIRGGDNMGYYLYLPAAFIYHDLHDLEKSYEARNRICNVNTQPGEIPERIPKYKGDNNGSRVIKYTMGVAVLQSPFFFVIHLTQKISGNSAGGFEFPYFLAVFFSVLFYVLLGFYLLHKALLRWFSPGVTAVTMLVIFFATNLYYYTSFNIGMSHGYLFFLYCLLVYITPRFYDSPNWKNAVTLGFTSGMIALIRPAEAIAVFIPLLYGLGFKNSWVEKFNFIKLNRKYIVLTAIVILLVPLPQFYYWKVMSGHWLYDSYPGEHFNFLKVHFAGGMFGWKNGWLSYTTVMLLVFPGIYFLWRNKNSFSLPVSFFLPLHIYIIYSWWGWTYTNGFGSRPMVETYGLLALPLAAFLNWAKQFNTAKIILTPLLLFFAFINIFKVVQIEHGLYYSDDATWNFYKRRLLKWGFDYKDVVAFDNNEVQPGESKLILVQRIAHEGFENQRQLVVDNGIKKEGNFSALLKPGTIYNGVTQLRLGDTKALKGDYIKIIVWCYAESIPDIFGSGRLVAEINDGAKNKKWVGIRIENKIRRDDKVNSIWGGEAGIWKPVHFFVKLPADYTGNEILKVYPWNPGNGNFRMDELDIELWRKIR